MAVLTEEADGFILEVKVRPNASRTEIKCFADGEELTIAVAAPAEKGKANKELLKFLSVLLGIPREHVTIVSGEHTKRKRVRVAISASLEHVFNLLASNVR